MNKLKQMLQQSLEIDKNMFRILIIILIGFSLVSCGDSNVEVINEGGKFLKENEYFLNSLIYDIEHIPNLNDTGHVFIRNYNYRNQDWNLTFNRTKDKNDTIQIDKNIVSRWIRSGIIMTFEYDIVNRITYFQTHLENKNGRFILLVHQSKNSYSCIKEITDTTQFNRLPAFKYHLNDNWLIFSPNDWSVNPNIMGYEGLVFYPSIE